MDISNLVMPLPFYSITALKAVDIQTTERITKFRLSCKLFVYLCVWSNKITISKYCQMTLIANVKFLAIQQICHVNEWKNLQYLREIC